jgi:hypothetical protein
LRLDIPGATPWARFSGRRDWTPQLLG